MARLDRYMLLQFFVLFGFFSLVLILVYWVNQAVVLFDQIIANGESAWVFLELTALSLPFIILIVLPMSVFGAAAYVTNRLVMENEMVVAEATGYSPTRLARPVFLFGILTGLFALVLSHVLVPMSQVRANERRQEIAQNITSRFLTEGTFVHPAEGITLYVRTITPEGELRDVFFSDARDPDNRYTYTAKRALVAFSDNSPKLVMLNGLVQVLSEDGQRLITTGFENFTYDISSLVTQPLIDRRGIGQLTTAELLSPSPALLSELRATAEEVRFAIHSRSAEFFLSLVAALTGFSMLMLGNYSRFGLWRQIIGAIALLAILKSFDNSMIDIARRNKSLWGMLYVSAAVGILVNMGILWLSARPALFGMVRRRRARRAMA